LGIRTREGMGVSETVRWTIEQPMVEAVLYKDCERLQLRSSGNPLRSTKQKDHLL